jgi:putative phosphoesterase
MLALPGKVYEVCSEADLVLHSGDLVEGDIIRDLERFAPLRAVQGNMDAPDVKAILPERLTLEIEGHKVCMAHGRGTPMGLAGRVFSWFRENNPNVVIFGHSHIFQYTTMHGTTILNPGSAAGKSGQRSMAILTLEEGQEPEIEHVVF